MSKSSPPTPEQLRAEGRKFSDAGDRVNAARSFSREGDAYTEQASRVRAYFTAFVEAPEPEQESYRAKLQDALSAYNSKERQRQTDEQEAHADFVQRSAARAAQFAAKGDQLIDGVLAPNSDLAQNIALFTKAASQYENASKFDEQNPAYYHKHATAHFTLGAISDAHGSKDDAARHYIKAHESFTKAATLDPQNPEFIRGKEIAREELGNRAPAQSWVERTSPKHQAILTPADSGRQR